MPTCRVLLLDAESDGTRLFQHWTRLGIVVPVTKEGFHVEGFLLIGLARRISDISSR